VITRDGALILITIFKKKAIKISSRTSRLKLRMHVNSLIFVFHIFNKLFKVLFVLSLHLRLKQASLAFAFS